MDQKIEDLDNVELLEKYKSVIKAESKLKKILFFLKQS